MKSNGHQAYLPLLQNCFHPLQATILHIQHATAFSSESPQLPSMPSSSSRPIQMPLLGPMLDSNSDFSFILFFPLLSTNILVIHCVSAWAPDRPRLKYMFYPYQCDLLHIISHLSPLPRIFIYKMRTVIDYHEDYMCNLSKRPSSYHVLNM